MALLPSGLAGSGSQEVGASLTWTGGQTTGEGERERSITTGQTCQSLTEMRESERSKGAQLLGLNVVIKRSWSNNRLWFAGTRANKSVFARI